jgi:hypothetical protein
MDISPPQLVLRSLELVFMCLFFWAYYKYNFLSLFVYVDGLFLKVLKVRKVVARELYLIFAKGFQWERREGEREREGAADCQRVGLELEGYIIHINRYIYSTVQEKVMAEPN